MNSLLQPPAERDLPPARAARMRADLLAATRPSRARVPRRLLIAAAGVAVIAGIAGVAVTSRAPQVNGARLVAMSVSEQDPSMRNVVRDCLESMEPRSDGAPQPAFVPVSPADVTITSRRGPWISTLFLTPAGYMTCDMDFRSGRWESAAVGGEAWPHRDWLPGPVQTLSLSSTDIDGGSVSVLGRVSARVDRLVLEHGNGRTSTAKISGGAFGMISATDDVGENAALVSYDTAGREIDRRPLFGQSSDLPHCYTDPAGAVIYGDQRRDCLPAEPWTR